MTFETKKKQQEQEAIKSKKQETKEQDAMIKHNHHHMQTQAFSLCKSAICVVVFLSEHACLSSSFHIIAKDR